MSALAAWLGAVPAILVAVLVLLVPGLVATAPLPLARVARVAVSAVVGIASIGAAGVLFGLLGVGFAFWQPLLVAIVIAALASPLRRRTMPARPPREGVRWWWLVLTWLAASAVIAVVAFAAVPTPDRISQTYDNVFHLAAIAHILETGDASSLTLRTLIETDRTWAFYPAAWHSLAALVVQLTGVSVPVAVNAAWIAVCTAVWVPGVAWLAQALLRAYEPGGVALIAMPLAAAFGAMPYALLTWGTLYPTFLATSALPVAVAIPVATWAPRRPGGRQAALPLVTGAAALLVALVAIGFSQPRVLVTWAVLLAPFAIAEAVSSYRWARQAGGRARRIAGWSLIGLVALLVAAAAGGFAYLVLRLGLFDRPLDARLAGPQALATQSVLAGLWQVLSQSWPLGLAGVFTVVAVMVAMAVLVGILTAARTRGLRWVVVAYAALAVLFALAAGSDDLFAKLATALWYKDRYRLGSALPVLGVVLATLGVLAASSWLARRRRVTAAILAVSLAWAATVTAALGMLLGGVSSTVAFVFRLPQTAASSEVVSQAQIDFMAEVARIVPTGQRVLGDPWDGSALSLLYAGREPVFPHVNGQWDAERALIAWRLQDIDTDPLICAALDALQVRYVLYNPHAFGGGDPSGNHFIGVHTAVEAGLFTPVATDGDSTLYRIDQCGVLPG
ncbi:MAG: hypothetical protein QM626_06165 [Microbacterium sp.]|uniref:DUF6541 family protein n=1 Tax=Microbacterium sp. TaxID=51671 RepID=UPI0039E62F3B